MGIRVWGVVAALSFAAAPGVQAAATKSQVRIHEVAGEFLRTWTESNPKGLEASLQAFKARVVPTAPDFYKARFETWRRQGKNPDVELKKALADFPAIEPDFARRTRSIGRDLAEAVRTFVKAFPDFNQDLDIYALHSLGEGDGVSKRLGGKVVFFVGLDGLAHDRGRGTDGPFLHHQLFHVYQDGLVEGDGTFGWTLWREGLATYASEALNPAIGKADLMLDMPPGLIARCKERYASLLSDLPYMLKSKKPEDFRDYFTLTSKRPEIPARAGFYFGYLIAKTLAKRRPLSELARLRGETLLTELKLAIHELQSTAP